MILVFGATGMLGRAVVSWLSKNADLKVKAVSRQECDVSSITVDTLNSLLASVKASDNSYRVVINCVGCIPQRDSTPSDQYLFVNAYFPQLLARVCYRLNIPCIHITTDCVYTGLAGKYRENSLPDAETIYGISKSMGESEMATVIRTSIIGEEMSVKKSLLEWVRGHTRGETISGFTNHMWNGVTCIQLAKVIENIIIKRKFWLGVRHIFSPRIVSKFELVQIINEVYDVGLKITPTTHHLIYDRSLNTSYYDGWIGINIPDIKEQILEQKLHWEET